MKSVQIHHLWNLYSPGGMLCLVISFSNSVSLIHLYKFKQTLLIRNFRIRILYDDKKFVENANSRCSDMS